MEPRGKSEAKAGAEVWAVSPGDEACRGRLDRFLAVKADASRSRVRRWLERGAVRVGGRVARSGGQALQMGQVVTLSRPASTWAEAAGVSLRVLAEGKDWVAVDKPVGVPVHPLEPDEDGTLLGAVAADFPSVVGVGEEGELRSGVVHRLDVDTSGVVLFALSDTRWRTLRDAFTEHRVQKTYVALAAGRLERDGAATEHLAVTRRRPARVEVVSAGRASGLSGSRACSLAWRVAAIGKDCTRVEVDLHTGFLHQVRVMFAAMGHPLLGDAAYAPPEVAERAPRQMLHAASIAVDDANAVAAWPGDLREVAEREGVG
ncbi:MAG: RluA family pseudouridine synthase [Planctomycetota bacterium]